MKMSPQNLLDWKQTNYSAGNVRCGQNHAGHKLPKAKWFHYSGDYRIGTNIWKSLFWTISSARPLLVPFLRELLLFRSIHISNKITVDNLAPFPAFLANSVILIWAGCLCRIQTPTKLHHQLKLTPWWRPDFIDKAVDIYGYKHFVMMRAQRCELDSPECWKRCTEHGWLFTSNYPLEQTIIERAKSDPKPLYYRESVSWWKTRRIYAA